MQWKLRLPEEKEPVLHSFEPQELLPESPLRRVQLRVRRGHNEKMMTLKEWVDPTRLPSLHRWSRARLLML